MKSTKPWKVGRTMQNQVGIGKQDFAALRESQCFYIDKTDFIRQWWNYRDDVTLITRPRRFGKTLNMSMLNCFFSNKYADRGDLFEGIDISEFPETAEEIPSNEDTAAASESDFYEEDMDAESENGQELLLEEIKNDKMHVYDYIPDKLYLVECHTMLGTINFSLVNNYMDVFGDKIPLYSLFIVQYNQGTSLGQLLQDVDLRQYNMQIPDKIIDEISDAVNYIRGYMGRE